MKKIDRKSVKENGDQKLASEQMEEIMDKLDEIVDWVNRQTEIERIERMRQGALGQGINDRTLLNIAKQNGRG